MDACRNPEPLGLRLPVRRDDDESLETREREDARGECPRCEVIYGLRLLEVRRGAGEYGLLPGCGVAGPEAAAPEASRSSHMTDG